MRFRRACNTRLRDTFNWWAYTFKRVHEPTLGGLTLLGSIEANTPTVLFEVSALVVPASFSGVDKTA